MCASVCLWVFEWDFEIKRPTAKAPELKDNGVLESAGFFFINILHSYLCSQQTNMSYKIQNTALKNPFRCLDCILKDYNKFKHSPLLPLVTTVILSMIGSFSPRGG